MKLAFEPMRATLALVASNFTRVAMHLDLLPMFSRGRLLWKWQSESDPVSELERASVAYLKMNIVQMNSRF